MVNLRFTACIGMNTKDDPARLQYKADTGAWESPMLLNVDLDALGRVNRRRGFTKLQEGAWHSLWSNGRVGYIVNGVTLHEVSASGVLRAVKTDMFPGMAVSYVDVDGVIYWCNSGQKGKIVDGEAAEWEGVWPNKTTIRQIGEPPVGHLVEYHAGRIYIAVDNVVYFTEGAGGYDFVDLQSNHLPFLDSKVRMLRAVEDGLYIGTDAGVQFVGGMDPGKFQYRWVTRNRPVEGTDAVVPGEVIDAQINGHAVVWVDSVEINVGLPGGVVNSFTRRSLVMPAASGGCGLLYDNKYVALLAP